MKFNPAIHQRHSTRLAGYDYSTAGFYFVTICVQNHECLLGEIVEGRVVLNDGGRMVDHWWKELPQRFLNVTLDTFVVMPNHFHGIIILQPTVGAPLAAPSYRQNKITDQGAASSAPTDKTLGDAIRAFKSISAIGVNRIIDRSGQPLWQRNYYERIIRNEEELLKTRQYIHDNPLQWEFDDENPFNHQNNKP